MPSRYFHPRMSSRLGAFKLLEMDGSHEVMFTRPAELAAKIVEAKRGLRAGLWETKWSQEKVRVSGIGSLSLTNETWPVRSLTSKENVCCRAPQTF